MEDSKVLSTSPLWSASSIKSKEFKKIRLTNCWSSRTTGKNPISRWIVMLSEDSELSSTSGRFLPISKTNSCKPSLRINLMIRSSAIYKTTSLIGGESRFSLAIYSYLAFGKSLAFLGVVKPMRWPKMRRKLNFTKEARKKLKRN